MLIGLKMKELKELHDRETKITARVGMDNKELLEHTKLLKTNIEILQRWHEHFFGKGGLIKSHNQRLFFIKRISRHIPKSELKKIIE
jgi:hypothetical protein